MSLKLNRKITYPHKSAMTRTFHGRLSTGQMLNSKRDVEQLNQGALRITPSAMLMPLPLTISPIIEDTVGQAGRGHVLGSGQQRADLMVEHCWPAPLIHPFQQDAQLVQTLRHLEEKLSDSHGIGELHGADRVQDERDHLGTACFDGDRHHEEPSLVVGAGEGIQYRQIVRIGEVFGLIGDKSKVPQVDGRICRAGWQFEMR